jgi:hypothetical protein
VLTTVKIGGALNENTTTDVGEWPHACVVFQK